jgi:hypothetical protein
MRRKCLFIIVLLCQLTITARVLAQSAVRTSVGGLNKTNLMTKDEIDVKGSRYLTVGWAKGMVKMASGQIHKDMDLRYNQLDDELTFKNTDGSELSLILPL